VQFGFENIDFQEHYSTFLIHVCIYLCYNLYEELPQENPRNVLYYMWQCKYEMISDVDFSIVHNAIKLPFYGETLLYFLKMIK